MAKRFNPTSIKSGVNFRINEQGKVKLAEWTSSDKGKTITKLENFQITTMARDVSGNFIIDTEIHNHPDVGPKPTRLGIHFLFDDIHQNFITRFAMYVDDCLVCKGDGQRAVRIENEKEKEVSCPCDYINGVEKDGEFNICKPAGILNVGLDVCRKVGSVYIFRTHSWMSIENILTSLTTIHSITGGILAGIPLDLVVRPKSVKDKKKASHIVFIANVEFIGNRRLLEEKAEEIRIYRKQHNIVLPDSTDLIKTLTNETKSQQEEVRQEFYPDNNKPVKDKKSNSRRLF